jgi:hypothetical protein
MLTRTDIAGLMRGISSPIREAIAKALDPLLDRIAALEARPSMQDKGVWTAGTVYEPGDVCSHHGSGWVCRETHMATGADIDHDRFRLFVKKGRDAR